MSKYFEEMDKKARREGENKALLLAETLIRLDRSNEVAKATKDRAYRNKLYEEFNIK
jgi:hypothetical protein